MNCKAYLIFFIAALFLIMPVQATDPVINFIDPTEDNNTVIYTDHTTINTTVSDEDGDNLTALLNWDNSLVLWLPMNEGTGDVVEDFSGYGNNGSFIDGTTGNWTTDGQFGDAWVGDGVNDYVDCGNNASLNSTDAVTIEFWVKQSALSANFYEQNVISKLDLTTFDGYVLGRCGDGALRFWVSDNQANIISTSLILDTWHHIVGTVDGYDVKLYKDRVLQDSDTLINPIAISDKNLLIGSQPDYLTRCFNGTIDEVRIYNRALTNDEINASYNASAYRLFNNFTGLADREYNYTAYVQDENGNVNSTETRYLTVRTPTVITLLNQTPTNLTTQSTGSFTQVWGVSHSDLGLYNSSIAYTFGLYDTIDSSYRYNLRPPNNNKATYDAGFGETILRGLNRNESLTWENNATITGGDIYTWNGFDYYSDQISFEAVNSTYTNVTVTGYILHMVFPFSTYLDYSDLIEAPKTGFAIDKSQYALIKFWDKEASLGHTHLGFAYFDGYIGSSAPVEANPIEIYYLNESFDPNGAVHPDDSPYLYFLASMNASEWATNDYSPHTNSSYVNSVIVNSSDIEHAGINVTGIAYLYLKSNAASSKSYYLNVTDVASSTNISFADTDVMWTVTITPASITSSGVTPNVFTSFIHSGSQYQSKLWIQDNYSVWTNSSLETTNITKGFFDPTQGIFEHFEFEGYNDTSVDCTYRGTMNVYLRGGVDPDGGEVSNNLTLHYVNSTYVATINNTMNTTGADSYKTVEFDTSSYYSTTDLYTLKLNSTDDEGVSTITSLSRAFSLSPLGTTGVLYDDYPTRGRITFWGVSDIPTLYTLVSNTSRMSFSGGIYTMNTTMHHSQYSDAFAFNESVRLKSENCSCTPYYRITGTDIINNAKLVSWNSTLSSPAPITDEYRSYMYTDLYYNSINITNSNLSYLGVGLSPFRGVHLQDLKNATIDNNIFISNSYGLYVNTGSVFSISNNTITDPHGEGLFIGYTDGSMIIRDNVINSNASSSAAIHVLSGGSNNEFINNTISGRMQSGIFLRYINDSTVEDNVMSDMQYGIQVSTGTENITVINNNVNTKNDIFGNPGRGITTVNSLGGHNISNNIITVSNGIGIDLFNTVNVTMIGNSVTSDSVAYADYFVGSTTTGAIIRNPADTDNTIQINAIGTVLIENTDSYVFDEDGSNTTYAYNNSNFSMYVSNVAETITITQLDMTILPSNDSLAVWGVTWGDMVRFNVSSDIVYNPTWYNITRSAWSTEILAEDPVPVRIYRNDTLISYEYGDTTGDIAYNYSEYYFTNTWFEFSQLIIEDPLMIELERIQRTQTLIQALLFMVIAVVVGVVMKRRRDDDFDYQEYRKLKNK